MIGHATIEMIGTIEIVTEPGTGRETEAVTASVNETEHVIVVGTEVVTMTVTGSVIVIALVTRRGTGIMKVVTLTVIEDILVTGNLNLIVLSQNMRGTAMVKGTMIMSQRMTVDGMNTLSTMSIIGASSKVTMIVIINTMTMIMIDMIKWRRITIMTMQRLKGRELEMLIMNIDNLGGQIAVV